MHFHAEHSLFFERRQHSWRAAISLIIAMSVLLLNAGLKSLLVSGAAAAVAAVLLLIAYTRGHRRMEPALAWTVVLVASALLGGAFLDGDLNRFTATLARVSCGVLWVLWLGTQLDWSALRQLLAMLRVPESVVGSMDHAIMNGMLTKREWVKRRDAARMRLGKRRLPLAAWGQVLGEGALRGFLRLESMEENALLRSACSAVKAHDDSIHLDNVNVKRGEQLVLENVNLRLGAGERLLVCGPSGAGKSSLLRLLAGLDNPSQGTMNRLGDTVSVGASLQHRLDGRIGLLTQNPEHHFIASTVAEDIAWGLLRRGVEPGDAVTRAKEMAQSLGVAHLLDRPCHALSFGEQRRVALAGILVLEPTLLLLDEPTAGLDPVAAQDLQNLVESSIELTGAACIWATHDLHALPPQASRIVLLRNGNVIFDGPTEEGLSDEWMIRAGLAVARGVPIEC